MWQALFAGRNVTIELLKVLIDKGELPVPEGYVSAVSDQYMKVLSECFSAICCFSVSDIESLEAILLCEKCYIDTLDSLQMFDEQEDSDDRANRLSRSQAVEVTEELIREVISDLVDSPQPALTYFGITPRQPFTKDEDESVRNMKRIMQESRVLALQV